MEAIAEIAADCGHRLQFANAMLSWFSDAVGYSRAFFATSETFGSVPSSDYSDLAAEGFPESELTILARRAPAFAAELAPVKKAAARNGGVAVDTLVLGRKACETEYYRELVVPAGGGHSLLCFLELRGQVQGLLMLGCTGDCFREREVNNLRRLSRGLAVALASFVQASPLEVADPIQAALFVREREIASYLRLGYTNAEIALALGTSANTVRNQLSVLFRKVGVSTRSELVGLLRHP